MNINAANATVNFTTPVILMGKIVLGVLANAWRVPQVDETRLKKSL